MRLEFTASQKRPKEVYCHRHGIAPGYGPKDDLKCLPCAKRHAEARLFYEQLRAEARRTAK